MPFTLRIIFDGIVVTGPPAPPPPYQDSGQPPPATSTRSGPFYAVMPLLGRRLSRLAPPQAGKEWYIPAHIPVMITSDRIYVPDEERQPDEKRTTKDGCCFYLWYPLRERMEFELHDTAYADKLTYIYDDEQLQQGEYRLHSADKIPRMEEIYADRDRLANGTLSVRPPSNVAAQIFIPNGEVSGGTDYNQKKNAVEAKFLPPRTGDANPKTIVPNAVVTIRDVTTVSIRMSSLDSGETLDPIVFTLEQNEDIRIANGDPENIGYVLELLSSGSEIDVGRKKPVHGDDVIDIDFEGVYDLLAGPDDGEAMPVPFYDRIRFGMTNCYGGSGKPPTG
jgi:hypothetical protein